VVGDLTSLLAGCPFQFNTASMIFFVTYVFFEVPSSTCSQSLGGTQGGQERRRAAT
jgi:hypothetical protein